MRKRSKAYRAAAEKIDAGRIYSPLEAAKLVKETSTTKNFDATVDVAIRLGVDPRKADQLVRGTVSLPHGTGRPLALWSLPLAKRQPKLRPQALTLLAPTT